MTEVLKKLEVEKPCLNMLMAMYNTSFDSIVLFVENWKQFSQQQVTATHSLPLLLSTVLDTLAKATKQEWCGGNWKEEVKSFPVAGRIL